jgi:hypothetical protein
MPAVWTLCTRPRTLHTTRLAITARACCCLCTRTRTLHTTATHSSQALSQRCASTTGTPRATHSCSLSEHVRWPARFDKKQVEGCRGARVQGSSGAGKSRCREAQAQRSVSAQRPHVPSSPTCPIITQNLNSLCSSTAQPRSSRISHTQYAPHTPTCSNSPSTQVWAHQVGSLSHPHLPGSVWRVGCSPPPPADPLSHKDLEGLLIHGVFLVCRGSSSSSHAGAQETTARAVMARHVCSVCVCSV